MKNIYSDFKHSLASVLLLLLSVLLAGQVLGQSAPGMQSGVEEFPNYHPLVVHFPIVLLLLAALMQVAGFFIRSEGYHRTILVLGVLGYATAWFAAAWRHPHIDPDAVSAAAKHIFDEHQKYARWSVWAGGAGALAKGIELYFKRRMVWALLTTLLLSGAAGLVAVSGHHGAELVHKHGIGPKGGFLKKSTASIPPEVHEDPNAIENDTTVKSVHAVTSGTLGNTTVQIRYSSPKVRGRVIWGELVPFGKIWVAGANNATSVEFSRAVEVSGTPVEAGKYAFFAIPGAESWTLILNKNWDQHLADKYDPKDDVVRVEVKPQPNAHTERLQYFVEPPSGDASGGISMAWESLKVLLPIRSKS